MLHLIAGRLMVWIALMLLCSAIVLRYFSPASSQISTDISIYPTDVADETGQVELQNTHSTANSFLPDLLRNFGWTLGITLTGVVLSVLIFLPLALNHAHHPSRRSSRWILFLTTAVVSMPSFLIIIVLLGWFAETSPLGFLPATGAGPVGLVQPTLLDRLPYLILPVATYAILAGSTLYRYTRQWAALQLQSPVLLAARGKGIPAHQLLWQHVFSLIKPSVISLLALELSVLIGGSLVVERIFSLPGMGGYLQSAASSGDATRLLSGLALVSGAILSIQLLSDILLRVRATSSVSSSS